MKLREKFARYAQQIEHFLFPETLEGNTVSLSDRSDILATAGYRAIKDNIDDDKWSIKAHLNLHYLVVSRVVTRPYSRQICTVDSKQKAQAWLDENEISADKARILFHSVIPDELVLQKPSLE